MEEKKTIDIVVRYFYPVAAGIETNILETYSHLVNKGWVVRLHTSRDEYEKKNTLQEEEVIRGIQVKRYSFGIFGFQPKIDWPDAQLICLHNFDIFPHFWILIRGLLWKILQKKQPRIIVTPHGGYNPEWSIFTPTQAFIKRLYHKTIGLFFMRKVVSKIRAVSLWEKNEMITSGIQSNKITVISNGIETQAFDDVDNKASTDIRSLVQSLGDYVIQVGRVYPIKNYETTIRSLAGLPKTLSYVIVGPIADSEYYKELQKLSTELGVYDRVKFLGVIRGYDKFYLIRHARMMVHMAKWESFCNVVHESMSQGVIPIVADNTALPFLVQEGRSGFTVETYNEVQLAERIRFVLASDKQGDLESMKKFIRTQSKDHAWSEVAKKMDHLYLKNVSTMV